MKKIKLLTITLILSAVLTGCGSSNDNEKVVVTEQADTSTDGVSGSYEQIYDENDDIVAEFQVVDGLLVKYYGFEETATIPDNVKILGDESFADSTYVKYINIPASITDIGNFTFANCTSLEEIIIPNTVKFVGNAMFYGCKAIESITIPDSITSISSSMFSGCSALNEINIPETITSIGQAAFLGCSALTEITIPESVTEIGESLFDFCSELTTINVKAGSYAETFFNSDETLSQYVVTY